MSKLFRSFLASCLVSISVFLTVFAQSSTATLSGAVEDQNSQAIAGAAITIQNKATSFERTTTTDGKGQFAVPFLPPGSYSVLVRREGFSQVEVSDVVLYVGDQKSMRVQLKVGDVTGTVDVRPNESLVNTSATVVNTIDRNFVGNLPLSGRSFQSLILLTPGVTVTSASLTSGNGQFSVNGQRSSTNVFLIDGVSGNIGVTGVATFESQAAGGALPGLSAFGGTNNLVSQDALEEFKIQTSTYSAEFGRQPGGQVSLVTRSGTNDFHGSVFDYVRNTAFDARNYFNKKPLPQNPIRQHQFGGTIGGPVYFLNIGDGGPSIYKGKDRTFFFVSYEGQRLVVPVSGLAFVPSTRLRNLVVQANSPFTPIVRGFAIPTGPEIFSLTGQATGISPWNYDVSNTGHLDAFSSRLDHAVTAKDAFFLRYNESPSDISAGDTTLSRAETRTRTLTTGLTSTVRPNVYNEFRVNFSTNETRTVRVLRALAGAVEFDQSILGEVDSRSFIFLPGTLLAGTGAGSPNISTTPITPPTSTQRQFNIVNNVSISKGGHTFKAGMDYRRLSPVFPGRLANTFIITSESHMISGIISSGTITNSETVYPQFTNFSAFAQDSWVLWRRLTLDLGVRWELNPAPTEANKRRPPTVMGVEMGDLSRVAIAPPGTPFYKTFYTAFAPRFGAAYQLTNASGRETVLRGGFGVYYDLGNGAATRGYPFSATKSFSNRAFPLSAADQTPLSPAYPTALPVTVGSFALDPKLKLPYTLQWNIGVEQSLGKGQALSVAYVGAAARQLLINYTFNQPAGTGIPRQNPSFRDINYLANGPTSDYNSMQVQYRARLGSKFQALVNYTWSHAIDELSSDLTTQVTLDRADANFDVRHNFSSAISYELPMLNGHPVLNAISRGWAIDSIVHAQSGQPVDIFSSVFNREDGTNVRQRPDLVLDVPLYLEDPNVPGGRRFNPAAFVTPSPVCVPNPPSPNCVNIPSRQGSLGRNALRELPIYQIDLALRRRFVITEHWYLQLKAEVFNILNHPMFSGYGRGTSTPSTFGVPSNTLNSNLSGLSSIYQIGGPRSMQFSAKLQF